METSNVVIDDNAGNKEYQIPELVDLNSINGSSRKCVPEGIKL